MESNPGVESLQQKALQSSLNFFDQIHNEKRYKNNDKIDLSAISTFFQKHYQLTRIQDEVVCQYCFCTTVSSYPKQHTRISQFMQCPGAL